MSEVLVLVLVLEAKVLVLVLVLDSQVLVLVLVLDSEFFKVLVLVLVLDPQVLVLVLVLVTEVLVNITGKRRREKASTTFSRDGFLLSRGTKWNHTEILRYKHCLS